jgi:hypothetical protein
MAFHATVVQKKLEEAGFEPRLAFGLASVLERDVVDDLEVRLVTREYLDARLAELKSELKTEIASLRTELRTDIGAVRTDMSGLKAELIKWMTGLVGGSTLAIIIALLRVAK